MDQAQLINFMALQRLSSSMDPSLSSIGCTRPSPANSHQLFPKMYISSTKQSACKQATNRSKIPVTNEKQRPPPDVVTNPYRGVSYYRRTGRWAAQIWVNGKQVYLGMHSTAEEAAKAYDEAAIKYHGDSATLNLPHPSYPHLPCISTQQKTQDQKHPDEMPVSPYPLAGTCSTSSTYSSRSSFGNAHVLAAQLQRLPLKRSRPEDENSQTGSDACQSSSCSLNAAARLESPTQGEPKKAKPGLAHQGASCDLNSFLTGSYRPGAAEHLPMVDKRASGLHMDTAGAAATAFGPTDAALNPGAPLTERAQTQADQAGLHVTSCPSGLDAGLQAEAHASTLMQWLELQALKAARGGTVCPSLLHARMQSEPSLQATPSVVVGSQNSAFSRYVPPVRKETSQQGLSESACGSVSAAVLHSDRTALPSLLNGTTVSGAHSAVDWHSAASSAVSSSSSAHFVPTEDKAKQLLDMAQAIGLMTGVMVHNQLTSTSTLGPGQLYGAQAQGAEPPAYTSAETLADAAQVQIARALELLQAARQV